jgi:mercuric reductase
MATDESYDLVILGSGSTAFAAALRAQELGRTAVMTEARTIGGTCVNRGCLPSKNLIEAAKLIFDAKDPRYPGLTPTELPFDFRALVEQKDEVIRTYRGKKYESLIGARIQIEMGQARFLDAHTVEVGGKRLSGDKFLIATGSRPMTPAIAGLSEVPYLTSDLLTSGEPIEMTERPRSLLIVGAGYVALELGQMFRRFGVEVTIVERGDQLLPHGYEPEVGRTIAAILESEGIRIITRALPRSVRHVAGEIVATVEVEGRVQELRAERLLVATGRQPNTDAIAVERAAVKLGERGLYYCPLKSQDLGS